MATYTRGDIWNRLHTDNGYIIVTTNNTIDSRGQLVMGAGAALQAKLLFPALPRIFGQKVRALRHSTYAEDYWLVIADIGNPRIQIGGLQTKRDWRDPSPLELVEASIDYLRVQATVSRKYGDQCWHCVMPGIGYGGLNFETVQKFTDTCPENVTFWYK